MRRRVQDYLDTMSNLNLKDYVNYKVSEEVTVYAIRNCSGVIFPMCISWIFN